MALVLWSGGCDSTLVLSELIDKFDKMEQVEEINVIAILHDQVLARTEQKEARKQILKILKKKQKIQYAELTMKSKGQLCITGSGLTQSVLWITNAMQYLGDDEDLYLGYIRGDDYWGSSVTMCWAFDYLKRILGKNGDLKLPLQYMRKGDVIRELKKRRLYSKIWYCEDPKGGRKCHKCEPCITHRIALERIKYEDKKKCHKPQEILLTTP